MIVALVDLLGRVCWRVLIGLCLAVGVFVVFGSAVVALAAAA